MAEECQCCSCEFADEYGECKPSKNDERVEKWWNDYCVNRSEFHHGVVSAFCPPPNAPPCPCRESKKPPIEDIGRRVGEWRLQNFGEQSRMRNLAQITEEVGEVARAAGKEEEGIRPETRGNIADELGDVILATCGMAYAEGIDLSAVIARRLERMEGLDFTDDPEGGEGR